MSFWVHAAAAKHPDRIAIEGVERSLTYAELSAAAIEASSALARVPTPALASRLRCRRARSS